MYKIFIAFLVYIIGFPAYTTENETVSTEAQVKPDSFTQNTTFTKEEQEKLVKFLPDHKKEQQ